MKHKGAVGKIFGAAGAALHKKSPNRSIKTTMRHTRSCLNEYIWPKLYLLAVNQEYPAGRVTVLMALATIAHGVYFALHRAVVLVQGF